MYFYCNCSVSGSYDFLALLVICIPVYVCKIRVALYFLMGVSAVFGVFSFSVYILCFVLYYIGLLCPR